MNRIAPWSSVVVCALMAASTASAASQLDADEGGQSVTIKGEIVDPAMYLRQGRHGPEAADQTYEAVDGGQTLALLEEGTGTLYLLLAEEPGEDPNELVYDHVNRKIKLTGQLYERGGAHGVVPASVESLEPAPASPAAAPNAPGEE